MTRLTFNGRWCTSETVAFLLASIAAAVLMYYTPDYLHLSVAPQKKRRWEINLRWRIAGTALLLGLLLAPSNGGRLFAIFAGIGACRRKLACAQERPGAKSSRLFLDHRSSPALSFPCACGCGFCSHPLDRSCGGRPCRNRKKAGQASPLGGHHVNFRNGGGLICHGTVGPRRFSLWLIATAGCHPAGQPGWSIAHANRTKRISPPQWAN